ncbi:DUF975 family protein [Thorsellia kenyensis]|uniref:DUF975 family protein n=1 Tax=Thorsellia kenyensis TaxID=1549888 RepID=A0ABV6CAB7_9GAMM
MNKTLKKQALDALNEKWSFLFLCSLLARIITFGLPIIIIYHFFDLNLVSMLINSDLENNEHSISIEMKYSFYEYIWTITKLMLTFAFCIVLLSPFWTCYKWLLLDTVRNNRVTFADLFIQVKKNYFRLVRFYFLYWFYILCWSCLFIIPGYIKMHSYALAPFLLRDNKQISANEAISKSRELMDGKKVNLLSLAVSFFGWYLLMRILIKLNNMHLFPMLMPSILLAIIVTCFLVFCATSLFYLYFFAVIAKYYDEIINSTDINSSPLNKNKLPDIQNNIII